MKRYRQRSPAQAELIRSWSPAEGRLPLAALFGAERASLPLRLEVGFGHGEFLSQLAAAHPDENHLGIEIDPLRVTKTAHKSNRLQVDNLRLFAGEAHRFVRDAVPPASVHRAYVLFSDPWPKAKHRRRRLLNRAFLLDLAWCLAPEAHLIIATDAHDYGFAVLSHLSTLPGLFANDYAPAGYRFDIPTRFPTVFQRHKQAEGCSICYLQLRRTAQTPPARVATRLRSNDNFLL